MHNMGPGHFSSFMTLVGLFINLMQGGVSRFHFMYTIWRDVCKSHP